jgi:hypothetical protein
MSGIVGAITCPLQEDGPLIIRKAARASSVESKGTRNTTDVLPPFSALTSDEERERKAESQEPGTYHVIANPSSFAALPEYSEEDADGKSMAELSWSQNLGEASSHSNSTLDNPEDPNVVILRTFEDPARRPSLPAPGKQRASPASPSPSYTSPDPRRRLSLEPRQLGLSDLTLLEVRREGENSRDYLHLYRTKISRHVLQNSRMGSDEDVFELQARTFPPVRSSHRHILHVF